MVNRKCVVAAILLAGLFAGSAQAQEDVFRESVGEAETSLLELLNRERREAEVADLKPNRKLMAAARIHAQNMAALDKGSHELTEAKEGWRTPNDRLEYVKYQGFGWGENIAWGSVGLETLVQGWMDSEPHRRNMLSTSFDEVGLGVVRGKSGRYICAVFGSSTFRRPEAADGPTERRPTERKQGVAGAKSQDETWRYRWHEGRWWYWLPSERWVVWLDGRWVEPW
jgi:uncharacterized protein YkwD